VTIVTFGQFLKLLFMVYGKSATKTAWRATRHYTDYTDV
jgi:hypothetical protein